MNFKAFEISSKINGNLIGSPNTIIKSTSSIEKTQLDSICYLDDKKYITLLNEGKLLSSVIIIQKNLKENFNLSNEKILKQNKLIKCVIYVNDAKKSFNLILKLFSKKKKKFQIDKKSSISKTAVLGKNINIGAFSFIDDNCKIDDNVYIYPNCFIGKNVVIKENTIIYPGVKIYDNSVINENCIIHAGCVIGSDGFGFINEQKNNIKIPHLGTVSIGKDVEIGANTCIDRGKTHSDYTLIDDGVKIDNLVQIGHNVKIGKNTVIAGCTGIAGSTTIGKNCFIGGKVAISNHIKIANNIKIAGNSGVTKSFLKEGVEIQGPIAFEKKLFQKSYINFKKNS